MTNPVTPAQAATPGQPAPQNPNPAPPANPAEGQVTITAKEYAQLQRNQARLEAFQRRASIPSRRPAPPASRPSAADPNEDPNEDLLREQGRASALEKELFDERVKNRTRDLLEKPEYKDLPESTKRLILRNPSSLSEAEDVDAALADIEDFILTEAVTPGQKPNAAAPAPTAEPRGHETPAAPSGAAAPVAGQQVLEDVSNLHGNARSRAVLRNKMKEARGAQG